MNDKNKLMAITPEFIRKRIKVLWNDIDDKVNIPLKMTESMKLTARFAGIQSDDIERIYTLLIYTYLSETRGIFEPLTEEIMKMNKFKEL